MGNLIDFFKSQNTQKYLAIGVFVLILFAIPLTLFEVQQQQTTQNHAATYGGFPDTCGDVEIFANDNGICPGSFKKINSYAVDFKIQSLTGAPISNLQWWVYKNFCGPGAQYHCSGGYPAIPIKSTSDSYYVAQSGTIVSLSGNGSNDLGNFSTDPNSQEFVSQRHATVNVPCGTYQTDIHIKYAKPGSTQTCEYNYELAAGWCETQVDCTNTKPTPTPTPTISVTPPTNTPTVTPTVTNTPTPTSTVTITPTGTVTPTNTPTNTPTSGPSATPTPTGNPTATPTVPVVTPTPKPTLPPTGPGSTILAIGFTGIAIAVLGLVAAIGL